MSPCVEEIDREIKEGYVQWERLNWLKELKVCLLTERTTQIDFDILFHILKI